MAEVSVGFYSLCLCQESQLQEVHMAIPLSADWAHGHHQLLTNPAIPLLLSEHLQCSVPLCTASITPWVIPHGLNRDPSRFSGCVTIATTVATGAGSFVTFKISYFCLETLTKVTDRWGLIHAAIVKLPQSWSMLDQHGCFSLCFPSCVKQLPLFSEDVGWNWHN